MPKITKILGILSILDELQLNYYFVFLNEYVIFAHALDTST